MTVDYGFQGNEHHTNDLITSKNADRHRCHISRYEDPEDHVAGTSKFGPYDANRANYGAI
jgi:hypothetical protein